MLKFLAPRGMTTKRERVKGAIVRPLPLALRAAVESGNFVAQAEGERMPDTVKLDQDRREAVRGTVKDTMVKVSKTSAADVYITAITPDDTTILHLGDSTVIAKRSHVRLHLFCRQIGDVKFSGEAELTELPDEPKPKAKSIKGADA
jgi:hypothetical protein